MRFVEVRRPHEMFGTTTGWSITSTSPTSYTLLLSDSELHRFALPAPPRPDSIWITCPSCSPPFSPPVYLLVDFAESPPALENRALPAVSLGGFPRDPKKSGYSKRVLALRIPKVLFKCKRTWGEEGKALRLSVGFRNRPLRHLTAVTKSREWDFANPGVFTTFSKELGVGLIRVKSDDEAGIGGEDGIENQAIARIVEVDSMGSGRREGLRVGDLLLSEDLGGTRTWCRLQTRVVEFEEDVCTFDLDDEEDENENEEDENLANIPRHVRPKRCFVTVSLRLCPSSESVSTTPLEPLEYLFGTEPVFSTEGVGNCRITFDLCESEQDHSCAVQNIRCVSQNYLHVPGQYALVYGGEDEDTLYTGGNETQTVLHHKHHHHLTGPLDSQNPNRLAAVWVGKEIVPNREVVRFRMLLQLSVGLSFVSVTPVTGVVDDVAFMSISHIRLYHESYADGTKLIDGSCRSFQIDDQAADAPFPVVIFPTLMVGLIPDAPAIRGTIMYVSDEEVDTIRISRLETFLRETTLRVHESFLLNIANFASLLMQVEKEEKSMLENAQDESIDSTASPQNKDPAPAPPKKIILSSADFKPMRFDITFSSATSSGSANASMMKQVRSLPFVSALVTAMASISDAPLRLSGVRLGKESKTLQELLFAIKRHYTNEIMRGLLAIAGSTDILGSPVNLLSSFSKGAFGFFYEPALALTLGYSEFGEGLKKGSSQLITHAAGGLLESFSKMFTALARSVSQVMPDRAFTRFLEQELKRGSVNEPINVREGFSRAGLVLLRSVLDALMGFVPDFNTGNKRHRRQVRSRTVSSSVYAIPESLLKFLLKPAAGFFAALSQFSFGLRNALTPEEEGFVFPLRMPRPRETVLLPYSKSRAAGYFLAQRRFGPDVKFVTHDICRLAKTGHQIESSTIAVGGAARTMYYGNEETILFVAVLLITSEWLVACRETGPDLWAVPITVCDMVQANAGTNILSFKALDITYSIECRAHESLIVLNQAIDFAKRAESGDGGVGQSFESFAETMRKNELFSPRTSDAFDPMSSTGSAGASIGVLESSETETSNTVTTAVWDSTAMRLRFLTRRESLVDGSELDVAASHVGSATIQSWGEWPDRVVRYRIFLTGDNGSAQWVVERRYKEFLAFRDRACHFLSVSRRCLPLPSRKPWRLTAWECEARRRGLQRMLDRLLQIDLLVESEVLREFLCRGADQVVLHHSGDGGDDEVRMNE